MDPFLDTVLSLARHQTSAGAPGEILRNNASALFKPFDESGLEYFFAENDEEGDTTKANQYIFMPMVSNPRLLPVLSLAYRLPDDYVKLQLAAFMEKDAEVEPRAFGYRYESPEPPGRHHFWHAQPILEVRRHDGTTIGLPGLTDGWRPPDTPAFPLDARCGLDLLACLLISLYGYIETERMQYDHLGRHLEAQIRQMRPPQP